jgi:XTP/dITP diphosphohydrolase
LQGKSDLERSAYLECALALAHDQKVQKCVTGICEGIIVEKEKGRNGFGYDAIFRKHDYDKTFAELDEAVKIRVSDRRKAFEKLALYLETLIADQT